MKKKVYISKVIAIDNTIKLYLKVTIDKKMPFEIPFVADIKFESQEVANLLAIKIREEL